VSSGEPRAGERPPPRPGPGGLCPLCRHVKVLTSDRGSTFYLCQLAKRDSGLPRYPPQPRLVCRGFER
jgi:hypothetical protein